MCIVLITTVLVGCQAKQEPTNETSIVATSPITDQANTVENKSIYGEDGLPPLNEELLAFYHQAYNFYEKYCMCYFQLEYDQKKEVNGLTYYRVDRKSVV